MSSVVSEAPVVDEAKVRDLVEQVRGIYHALVELEGHGRDDFECSWIAHRAGSAEFAWEVFRRWLRDGGWEHFYGGVSAAVGLAVPLSDAPRTLSEVTYPIEAKIERLAECKNPIILPWANEQGYITPEVGERLGPIMRRIGAELDAEGTDRP